MSDITSECPTTTVLVSVLDGDAPEPLISQVMEHLEHCNQCLNAIGGLSSQVEAIASKIELDVKTVDKGEGQARKKTVSPEDSEAAEKKFVDKLKSSFHFMTPTSIGHYKVLRKIGQGMMGEVFECEDPKTGGSVAVKTIKNHVLSTVLVTRMTQEARLLAGLDHPNIVRFIDFGMTPDGMPFLVLEYVEGGTLSDRIGKGQFSPRQAAALIRDCAEALDHAHARGVLHRDLKPSNILLQKPEGAESANGGKSHPRPKIADFGLARYFEGETHFKQSGSLVGTPGHMSPEQIHSGNRIGPESDIFSLGTILYEAMTGFAPFEATSLAGMLHQIQNVAPEAPRFRNAAIPRDLELICLKCLEKQPEDRYLKAADLAADLGRFLNDESILAKPLPLRVRFVRWCRSNSSLAASMLVSAFLMLSLAVGGVVFGYSQYRLLSLANWARINADQEKSNAVRDRDFAVKIMDDATTALYSSFLMTREGDLPGSPHSQRLRERIAGQFFDIANEARKIDHLERDKPLHLCGLLHKSAIIQWEMGAKPLALDLIRDFFEIQARMPESLKNLDGLSAQVIDLRMLSGMADFDRYGPDAGIASWMATWNEWYAKGADWRRKSPYTLRSLVNLGRMLLEGLERTERWDDLKRLEPQLHESERIIREIGDRI